MEEIKRVYVPDLSGLDELFLGGFITDGYPYVAAHAVMDALHSRKIEEIGDPYMEIPGDDWHFVALLDDERNVTKILIRENNEMAKERAEEFLRKFDVELERKLELTTYLFSENGLSDRYVDVRKEP